MIYEGGWNAISCVGKDVPWRVGGVVARELVTLCSNSNLIYIL